MLLSLRSLLPLSLSGVFALIGLWWYSARKKGRLAAAGDAREDGAADPPTSTGGGGLAEKERRAENDREKHRGLGSSEAAFTHTAAAAAAAAASAELGAAPLNQSEPEECARREDVAAVCASPDLNTATGAFCTASSESSKRPDPEGEVGEDNLALCFAEKRPPAGLLENSVLSKDILPVLAAAVGPVCGSSPREHQGPLTAPSLPRHLEPETKPSLEEMNQVAAGVITDVVSLAVAEVLRDEALLNQMEHPPPSRQDPCPAADGLPAENVAAQRDQPPGGKRGDDFLTAAGGIGTSSAFPGDGDPDSSSRPETQRAGGPPELGDDAGDGDDSSTSSTESDDASSEEDYHARSRPLAELPEDLSQSSGPIRGQPEALRNGHGVEEELTPGGAVTSMASGDSQTSTAQPSPSSQPDGSERLSPNQSTGPQTIWEIEVPKHLVGRLIGKQGRYVSYLKETSGAKVFISTLPFTQEVQICHVEGTNDQVETALDLIRMKFKDLELTNCYVPPAMPSLPALPITSWLLLPPRVTVEVQVAQVASGNYLFLQQHTHPTFHALHSLDQQMRLCYAHPGCPTLPAPVEVGVICAAQMPDGAWWRAQVMRFSEETREVEIRYVDYGGYHTVGIDALRQIRSDFVSLPFQGSEVILDNLACLPGEEDFSAAAKAALEDLTNGLSLLAQVTEFHTSGIPLVQIWRKDGNELVSVNQALVERGVCSWINRP